MTEQDDRFARQATKALRAATTPQDAVPAMRILARQHRTNDAAVRFCEGYVETVDAGNAEWAKATYGRGLFPDANIRVRLISGHYVVPVPGEVGWSE